MTAHLTWRDARTSPTEDGWYLCRLRISDRPVVLWWGAAKQWRAGAQLQPVTKWMGPIPQ